MGRRLKSFIEQEEDVFSWLPLLDSEFDEDITPIEACGLSEFSGAKDRIVLIAERGEMI